MEFDYRFSNCWVNKGSAMSNLKCPFCGQKLGRKNINDRMCSNEKCVSWKGNFYGSEDLWQELIRTRKALKIAWDGLEKIGSGDIIEHSVVGHEDDNKIFIANKALNESKTALEQKDAK